MPGCKSKIVHNHLDLMESSSISQLAQHFTSNNIKFNTIVLNSAVGADFGIKVPTPDLAHKTMRVNTTGAI